MFLPRSALILILLALPSCAQSAPYKSHFGFTVSVPSDWTAVSPETVAQATERAGDNQFDDLKMDASVRDSALERVKKGDVEFYYLGKTPNNIAVQLLDEPMMTAEEAKLFCKDAPNDLAVKYGTSTKLLSCGNTIVNGVSILVFEFRAPQTSMNVVQSEIPLNGQTLVVVGGTVNDDQSMPAVRAMQRTIVDSATQTIAGASTGPTH